MATTATTDRRGFVASLFGTALFGCSRGAAPAGTGTTPHESRGPTPRRAPAALTDYVPAAGLRWLLVGTPDRIAADPELAPSVALILEPERLAALEAVTGIRPDRLKAAAAAGFDLGTLYLAEIDAGRANLVRQKFAARLVHGAVERRTRLVRRLVGTTASGQVRALVTIEDRVAAIAVGDPTLARIVEAYAEGRLRSPTALGGVALRALPELDDATLFAFLAPGPFENEWGAAARGVLASADAVSIAVSKAPAGRLRATLTLAGDWSDGREAALAELERAWTELSTGPTGRLLGLDRAERVETRGRLQDLTLAAHFAVGPLARGLRAATSADVREILELGAESPEGVP